MSSQHLFQDQIPKDTISYLGDAVERDRTPIDIEMVRIPPNEITSPAPFAAVSASVVVSCESPHIVCFQMSPD